MSFNVYIEKIEEELSTLGFPKTPKNLYEPLDYFLKLGGKRLRPVLTLLAAELGGESYEKAMHAALAVEVFHNFSLIHDDIMDEAPIRRGLSTVHEKWNSNIAILTGDVLLVKAYQLLSNQKKEHLFDLLDLFNKTAIEVCEGQQLDMDFENREHVSVDEYLEMIRLKTSVLLGCALEFGFIISNQTKSNRAKIYEFGVNLGIAFQIQDDILDLFGDTNKVGKQVGGDVKSNKKTLLYLIAEQKAEGELFLKLEECKAIKDLDSKVEKTKALYNNLDVLEETKKYLQHYYDKAMLAINTVESNHPKEHIFQMVDFLFNRQH